MVGRAFLGTGMAAAIMPQLIAIIHLVKHPDWLTFGGTSALSHFMDDGTLMEVPLRPKLPLHVEVAWV